MVYLLIESVGSGAVPFVGWGRFVTDKNPRPGDIVIREPDSLRD
jgi:hypothetical protein